MNTSFPKSDPQFESGQSREQENAAGLWSRMKRLLTRLFPDRIEARRARIREAERKRQEIVALRQHLRDELHRRLDK